MPAFEPTALPPASGLAARRIATDILASVLTRRRPLDDHLDGPQGHPDLADLTDRDRALVRKLVATALRRLGTLRHVLATTLDRGLPVDAGRFEAMILIGLVQILWLDIPDHASVDLTVKLVRGEPRTARYAGLANAVLRRVARSGATPSIGLDSVMRDTPDWLMRRWTVNYGPATAHAIAAMHAHEPALDVTIKEQTADVWAPRLDGRAMTDRTVRLPAHGSVRLLPGYAEGAWWVQNVAAALPVRLLGDVRGQRVADLCAAPGGKTAQLAAAGAHVTAVDRSTQRLARLADNLIRLGVAAKTVAADATQWEAEPFDAVLVDPPCLSTGTIRRHPDLPWLKREADIERFVALQGRLLERAVSLTRPGGLLVYCTCSLEPEEGQDQIEALLGRHPGIERVVVRASEVCGHGEFITAAGDLRTLPCQLPDPDPLMAGLDGFFAARLRRR